MTNLASLQSGPRQLSDLTTPCLVLDKLRMARNIERLQSRLRSFGVQLNPHLKTCKSVEIARLMMTSPQGPCTVSSLEEADRFAEAGVRSMIHAVGIAPRKLSRVLDLLARGIDIAVSGAYLGAFGPDRLDREGIRSSLV